MITNTYSTWNNVRYQVSWKVQPILFCSIVHNNLSNEEKSFILNHVIPFLNTLNYSSVSLIILQRQALLHAFTAEKVLKYKCQIISTTCRQTHSMWNSFSLFWYFRAFFFIMYILMSCTATLHYNSTSECNRKTSCFCYFPLLKTNLGY